MKLSFCAAGIFHNAPWFIVGGLIMVVFVTFMLFLVRVIYKHYKSVLMNIICSICMLFVFLVAACVILVYGLAAFGILDDSPPSEAYHPLNAIVKQYCRYDTPTTFCPKTADQVRAVAPVETKTLLSNAHITYQYYPQTRDYTLIVRNDNYHNNNDRAVLFDSRLTKELHYGRNGLDFFDVTILSNCDGTFRITNPPPFSGPWDRIN